MEDTSFGHKPVGWLLAFCLQRPAFWWGFLDYALCLAQNNPENS
jgi:hypothetical protein